MKTLIILSLAGLCACASSRGALGGHVAADSIAGPWHGVMSRGDVRRDVDFRFSAGDRGYRGFYWSRALVPIEVTNLKIGESIHFEVPGLAVFDGRPGDETIEGKFHDENGEGSFKLFKQFESDDSRSGFAG